MMPDWNDPQKKAQPVNTPGYHRYMRRMWFFFGMTIANIWHGWWLVGIVLILVIAQAMWDIYKEEIRFEIPNE